MHWLWILGILAVVLIIFGPGRLPEIGTALGRGMREFRKASEELREEVGRTVDPLRQPAGRDGADQPAGAGGAAPPAEAPAPTSDSGPAAQG